MENWPELLKHQLIQYFSEYVRIFGTCLQGRQNDENDARLTSSDFSGLNWDP